MKYDEFVKLVSDMRSAQKLYFKYRSSDMLTLAKQLEQQVDDTVQRGPAQSVLFDTTD